MNRFPRQELLLEVFKRIEELQDIEEDEDYDGWQDEELDYLTGYVELYYPENVAMRLGLTPYRKVFGIETEDWENPEWYKGEAIEKKEEVTNSYPDLIDIML
jgi:hypothetical protein